MANPNTTYTVEDFISAGSGISISYNNLSYLETLKDGSKVPMFNVINDYMDDLVKMCIKIELDDAQYLKYRFKPKLLAYDIYGSQELYFIILLVNGLCDVKDFDKRVLNMLPVDSLNEVITYIYNSEKKALDIYNN